MRSPEEAAELAGANTGLAGKFVKRHPSLGLSRQDQEGAARLGLLRAARTYDPGKGKLSSYAWGSMRTAVRDEESRAPIVRVPRTRTQGERPEPITVLSLDADPDVQAAHERTSHESDPESIAIARADLARLLPALPPRLLGIITMSFGLDGGGERSLREIGRAIGLSPEWTRQLMNEALALLRRAAAAPLELPRPAAEER